VSQVLLAIALNADIKIVSQIILANEILPYPYCYMLILCYGAEAYTDVLDAKCVCIYRLSQLSLLSHDNTSWTAAGFILISNLCLQR
jgi:hypothetical protein